MKLTNESKLFLGIIAISVVLIGIASVVLTKPAPALTVAEVMPKGAFTRGNPSAKVSLVEFSDFQCPACLAVKPTLDAVLSKHKDTLIFSYRHFPLDQHPFARKAAQTAEAAGAQGKFWEMYDLLFANQDKFSDTMFSDLAKQLSLDMEKFEKDMKSSELTNRVANDQADGTRFGVNSTPTFFLNGKKLNLSSFDDLTREVDAAVKNSN